jgi:hypothetical protein
MRLSRVFALASLVAAPVIAQTIDICANVDADLFAELGLGAILGVGTLDVCLCLDAVAAFVASNSVCQTAANLLGSAVIIAEVEVLIEIASDSTSCEFPANCQSVCSSSNPCGFQCTNGFTQVGNDCVCVAPNVVCNGICTSSCGSSGYRKRDMTVLEAVCLPGHSVCGVWSDYGMGKSWECIDTFRNLESCGGCVTPLMGNPSTGRDCTSIPGVASVECDGGECIIQGCKRGWHLNNDGTACLNRDGMAEED